MSAAPQHRHTEACRGADEMLHLVPGLSYRQLDFWTTRGYVFVNSTHPGHGVYRCWNSSEVDVLRRALRLLAYGFRAKEAIERARTPGSGELLNLLEKASA